MPQLNEALMHMLDLKPAELRRFTPAEDLALERFVLGLLFSLV